MENTNNGEMEIDLLHILHILWRSSIAIILVAVITGGLFYGATKAFVTPRYNSRALLYVNSSNLSLAGSRVSISASELSAAKSLVDTYIVILNTRMTLNEVIERSGVSYSYNQLKHMISAASVDGTEIFYIDVESTDPAEAEMLANVIAEVLPDKIASIVDGSSVRIVDYAVRAAEKSSPSYSRNAVIGAVLGAFLVCAIVIIADLLDEQIHDSDYVTRVYGLPVLAAIPDLYSKNDDSYYYYKEPTKHGSKRADS